jgi:hypothetical protein
MKQRHLERSGGVAGALGLVLSGMARELLGGQGPVKWCKRCGRKHGSKARCPLVTIAVQLENGRMVQRRVHESRVPRP